jgi:hypothetical protein
LKSKLEII